MQIAQNAYQRENSVAQKYKFGKQELQDDLGLNWYHYKFRFHDPAVGRFFSVDPLADTYAYNSPYAFAENKLGLGLELEGLELVTFQDIKTAAIVSGNFLSGLANAVASNNTTLTNASGESVSLVERSSSSAAGFSAGQTAGDVASAVQSAVEIVAAVVVTAAGGTAEVASLGTATPVAVPAIAAGVALGTHGANTGANALSNLLGDNKGVVNSKGNSNRSSNRFKDKDDFGGDPSAINQKSKGQTKRNVKGQGSSGNEIVDAADQVDGLKKAQKQNRRAVENTDKSDQNLKNALKRRTNE